MLKIIEDTRRIPEFEEVRIVRDDNGFYLHQVRILPVADYEPNDGWMTDYVSVNPLTATKPYPYY